MRVMKCYEFVAILNLMCEVLPHLSCLSYLFQARYIQLSMIKPHLDACTKALESYKDRAKASDVTATDFALADQLQQFDITVSPQRKEAFDKNVRQPFLRLLLENLAHRFPQIELLCAFDVSEALPPPSATEEDRKQLPSL